MFWILSGASGKRITREEFRREVVPRLRNRGLSRDDIDFLEATIDSALSESGGQSGVDARELEQVIRAFQTNAPDHLSRENIDKIKEELGRALNS